MGDNDLIHAMSTDDLVALRTKYATNASVTTLIDGILEVRGREEEEANKLNQFTNRIDKIFNNPKAPLPHPDGVNNFYASWQEVEEEIGEPEEVEVIGTPAITDKDGRITTQAVMVKEMRRPLVKVSKWVVELNHTTKVGRGVGIETQGKAKASKRAITVYKRVGTTLDLIGHFRSGNKACDKLKLLVGGDSATRVLAREGYIFEPYDGTDYLA